MKFPAKVVRGYQITIPKNIRDYSGIDIGDEVLVDIVKKDSIEAHKKNIEEKGGWNK